MPRLTARAAAELLKLPLYEQLRILVEQKHPRKAPQVFRAPFYGPALHGIREYYRGANDRLAIAQARNRIGRLKLLSRRVNNERVISSFEKSSQSKRKLQPVSRLRVSARIGEVELSLSLDMLAHEAGRARFIYYNFRSVAADSDTAKATIEIAHWILETAGVDIPIGQIEYVDFSGSKAYRTLSRRSATIKKLKANAQVIQTLWPTL